MMNRAIRVSMVSVALSAGLALSSGCSPPPDEVAVDDGSRRGELALYISDDPQAGSETHYFLKDAAGAELRLLFDRLPELEPGTRLKVWGELAGDALRVTSFERLPAADSATPTRSALIGGTAFAPRSFAFVMIDIGGGINRTVDDAMARLITAPDSIRNYYLGDSYGLQDITAVVIPSLAYTPNGCDTSAMATALKPTVDAQGGPFQHYLWYYGSRNASCNWSGLASVGTPDAPQRNTWYNASTSCVVLVQEPGHNFGMQHSSSLACTGETLTDDPNSCTASEYGDRFDPMGGGCRHMNAWQKSYQGWLGGCNGVKVTDSGTFNLVPFEAACNGVQFLQLKAPKPRPFMRPAAGGGGATTENLNYYYLEVRTPVDFDGTLGNGTSSLSPRVLVHMADDLHTRTQRGLHTFLLDMTPTTAGTNGFSDAALPAGQTFTDPAGGLSFTVQSVSAAGATIVVNYTGGSGAPTCMDGSAFAPPGPGTESCSALSTGGTSGTAGTTGATGAAGMIGLGGRGGTGAGGTTGSAGSTGTVGTGGVPPLTGQAGSNGVVAPPGVSGGCACETVGGAPSPILLLALAFAGVVVRRRRRPRPGRG